ncbi:unnamed protein product [Paramecium octaurelia]|uniref:Ammonium transporter AmtB-like domain-containing protein n=1 Tax=Paramecium octaurelia TaxID=43137 RepID=A0A8S1SHZ3_PAROT|nr:unnamed protein product [Paramecium octaurelia]
MGYKDFSEGGVIIFASGVVGLVMTILLKPRRFRCDPNTNLQFSRHSPINIAFGSILVLSGWHFYNGGLIPNTHRVTGRFFALIIRYFQYETTSLVALSRGISSALVAVSAATDDMKSWTAFFQGFLAAGVYSVLTKAVLKHQIDDPVEVIPVMDFWEFSFQHFLTLKQVYGCDGKLLGMQLFGFLIIFVWVGFFILITLLMLKGFGVLELISHIASLCQLIR